MRRWRTWVLALASASLTTIVLVGCSSGAEQPILNQFFTASRLRDNSTLANFSTVSFEPGKQGTVSSFDIQSVSPEQHKPLNIKSLAKAQADAKAADAEYTKRKDAYESENIDAIKRVLAAERQSAAVKGKDAHPFYKWAATERPLEGPRWNFHKYLVGRDGYLKAAFNSAVEPTDPTIVAAIEKELTAA